MARRMYAGGAVETTITGSIASSGAVTVTIASAAGWPDAVSGPFAVVVDPGSPSEEKMLVTARSGTNLTVESGNRGYDGTSATAHTSGGVIYLTLTAVDLDEANSHVNATAAAHAASAIANTPAGSIAATTVQNAINELDTEKASTSHTQAASTITDFAEAARDTIGTALTAGTDMAVTVDDGADTITVARATSPSYGLGRVASASITASAGTGGTTQSAVAGLSVTFTAVTGRKYRVGCNVVTRDISGAAGITGHTVYLDQSGVANLQWSPKNQTADGQYHAHHITRDVGWSPGSVTIAVAISRSGGSGNIEAYATADLPCQLWVDDVGLT